MDDRELLERAARSAGAAEERTRIAARIREAWHQREASHGNRAGEYHEGMLAGLDAAVELALGGDDTARAAAAMPGGEHG